MKYFFELFLVDEEGEDHEEDKLEAFVKIWKVQSPFRIKAFSWRFFLIG